MHMRAAVDPWLKAAELTDEAKLYNDLNPHDDSFLSPHYADFGRPPPTLIQVNHNEILLEDSVRLANKLNTA